MLTAKCFKTPESTVKKIKIADHLVHARTDTLDILVTTSSGSPRLPLCLAPKANGLIM